MWSPLTGDSKNFMPDCDKSVPLLITNCGMVLWRSNRTQTIMIGEVEHQDGKESFQHSKLLPYL